MENISASNIEPNSADFVLRRLGPSDLTEILRLAESIGWGLSPQRILTFLYTAVGVGHEYQGRLVSCTFHFRFSLELTFVGLVLVHPHFQRRGLGRQVLTACLAQEDYRPRRIALIATEAGEPLYRSEGFVTVETLNRFMAQFDDDFLQRWGRHSPSAGEVIVTSVRHNPRAVLPEIVAFDKEIIGADRESLYRGFIVGVTDFVTARNAHGQLTGFGMATVFGGEMMSISPLMANSPEIATSIAMSLIGDFRGDVRLDVPEGQKIWSLQLKQIGFQMLRQSPVMVKGEMSLPGRREGLFSILDAAVG